VAYMVVASRNGVGYLNDVWICGCPRVGKSGRSVKRKLVAGKVTVWGQLVVYIASPGLKGGLVVKSGAADGPTIDDSEWTEKWE
jgi:hypothetical protein